MVVWRPNPGPQTWLLQCPVEDILFGGARGGGKTDGLLGDWIQHSGRHGRHARGIIFRKTMPELEDLIERSKELYQPLGAVYHEQKKTWIFPNGARLRMRYLERDQDAARYKGHQYTWIGFEEIDTWESPEPIDKLQACLRSPHNVPCVMRASANPGGPGHDWVKARYITPAPPLTPFKDGDITRVFIPSRLADNPKLSNPDKYTAKIKASGPEWLVKAWLEGDWSGPPVGGIIDPNWIRSYTTEPLLGSIDIAADLAFSLKQTADRTAIGAFGMAAGGEVCFKPDIRIGRLNTMDSVEAILDLAEAYDANRLFVGKDMITGSIGPFLEKRMEERKVWLLIHEIPQHQDQLLRSHSFIARTQQGKVLWPEGDLFRKVIYPELVSYDGKGEQHDDIVAMAAHACMGLDMMDEYRAPAKPKYENPDKKRWAELDRRRNHGKTTAIKPLFGK